MPTSPTHSPTHSHTQITHLLTHLPTHSIPQSFTHPCHSFTPLTHSLTHSLTHLTPPTSLTHQPTHQPHSLTGRPYPPTSLTPLLTCLSLSITECNTYSLVHIMCLLTPSLTSHTYLISFITITITTADLLQSSCLIHKAMKSNTCTFQLHPSLCLLGCNAVAHLFACAVPLSPSESHRSLSWLKSKTPSILQATQKDAAEEDTGLGCTGSMSVKESTFHGLTTVGASTTDRQVETNSLAACILPNFDNLPLFLQSAYAHLHSSSNMPSVEQEEWPRHL